MKQQLAQAPHTILKEYLRDLAPSINPFQGLEQKAEATIKKLNKTMKRNKRRLGTVLSDVNKQIDGRTYEQHT